MRFPRSHALGTGLEPVSPLVELGLTAVVGSTVVARPGITCRPQKTNPQAFSLGRDPLAGGESCGVERAEAEAILDGDRETALG
jgi:hypothetical protein